MNETVDPELEAMRVVHEVLAGLGEDERVRVLEWVTQRLGIALGQKAAERPAGPSEAGSTTEGPPGAFVRSVVPGVKEFVLEKRPDNDSERVAVLGYYLTHFRGVPEFKTRDITLLNREAKQPPISNAARAVNNAALQSHYLVATSGGKKQLTTRGEALVEALPDRARVKDVLAEQPTRRRRRHSKKDPKPE